jgi:hypothetical protein
MKTSFFGPLQNAIYQWVTNCRKSAVERPLPLTLFFSYTPFEYFSVCGGSG